MNYPKIGEVKKYLKRNYKNRGRKYYLKFGGLTLYFDTIREAGEYFDEFIAS